VFNYITLQYDFIEILPLFYLATMADLNYFLVAAIDFGTTFSGCAFQLTSDYQPQNPTNKIMTPQAWNAGTAKLVSLKTPTCLLLDNNGDLECFGYVAEDRYAELCMDGDHGNWYYFRRFKMKLYQSEKVSPSVLVC